MCVTSVLLSEREGMCACKGSSFLFLLVAVLSQNEHIDRGNLR